MLYGSLLTILQISTVTSGSTQLYRICFHGKWRDTIEKIHWNWISSYQVQLRCFDRVQTWRSFAEGTHKQFFWDDTGTHFWCSAVVDTRGRQSLKYAALHQSWCLSRIHMLTSYQISAAGNLERFIHQLQPHWLLQRCIASKGAISPFLTWYVLALAWSEASISLISIMGSPLPVRPINAQAWDIFASIERSVRDRKLSETIPFRLHLIYGEINSALMANWSRIWRISEIWRAFRDDFPRLGEAWTTLHAARGNRSVTLIAARLLVGFFYICACLVPWDPDEWVVGPWCGDDFTWNHLIWTYSGIPKERLVFSTDLTQVESVSYFSSRIG